MPLGVALSVLVLLPLLASFSGSPSPQYGQMATSSSRFSSYPFSNPSGKRASILKFWIWRLLVLIDQFGLPQTSHCFRGMHYSKWQGWVTSLLPAKKKRTHQSERPRGHVHRFGVECSFWVWKRSPSYIYSLVRSQPLLYLSSWVEFLLCTHSTLILYAWPILHFFFVHKPSSLIIK